MLSIKPYTSKDHFPQFEKAHAEGWLFYLALAKDQLIGFARYRKTPDSIWIDEIEAGGDTDLFDGLMRAVFDASRTIGIERAQFSKTVDAETLKTLHVPVDEKYCVNSLRDFLNNCRKCKMS